MLARLRDWLFDGGGPETLPERVREAIRLQQERSEIIIGWVQLLLVALVATVYESTSMPTGVVQDEYSFETKVFVVFGIFCIVRLVLAYRRLLRPCSRCSCAPLPWPTPCPPGCCTSRPIVSMAR